MSYKILSLDGGGSWALIQAYVLRDLYPGMKGHELLRQFDMAIANSGGSLVLAALCNDMSLDQIINVFEEEENRKKVFSRLTFFEKLSPARNRLSLFRNIFRIGPQYKATRKLEGLRAILIQYDHLFSHQKLPQPIVDTWLNELPALIGKKELQLIITGFDYFRERVSFFRSNLQSNTDRFSKGKQFRITLGHSIHASSNAPINYFDEPAWVKIHRFEHPEQRTNWFWDGAVAGFNNPVLAGLVEALTNRPNTPLSDYRILSIGTGLRQRAVITDYSTSDDLFLQKIYQDNKNNPYVISHPKFKFLYDIRKVSGSILSDPPDAATFIATSFLHPSLENREPNIVRINPCLSPVLVEGTYVPPLAYRGEASKFLRLMNLDMDAVKDEEIALIKDLCLKFLNPENSCLPNQLIRGDGSTDHLGYATYREARKRWMDLL